MQIVDSGYTIRSARIEELSQLAAIEQAAAIRFQDTPYAFLADGEPLPIEFIQEQFQAGQVWVVVDRQDVVIGFAITRAVDGLRPTARVIGRFTFRKSTLHQNMANAVWERLWFKRFRLGASDRATR